MKKIYTLVCLAVLTLNVMAEEVEPQRAIEVAEQFMQMPKPSVKKSKTSAPQTSEIVYTHYMPNSGRPAIYVINMGNAFALVSADDVAHPILGYNYGKSWPTDVKNLPPQVKSFLDDLAAQMEAVSEHPQDTEMAEEWQRPRRTVKRATNDNLPDSVGPLITTTWDQGQYYNALCPEDATGPDGHVWTGCVATAMAQIINYWGQKETIKTRGTHSYESNYGTLEVNFEESDYDFVHMPDVLTTESSQEEINAVAKLMYDCGVAVNMLYGPSESSAYVSDVSAALIDFWNFSPNLFYAQKFYSPSQNWDSLMRYELINAHPLYINTSDHALICDGYNNQFYHFNFGWNGSSDGWYLLSAIDDDGIWGYSIFFGAIFGIVPGDENNKLFGLSTGISTYNVDTPIEFYGSPITNNYKSASAANTNHKISLISDNPSQGLDIDFLTYDDETISIYEGEIFGSDNLLRQITPQSCDLRSIHIESGKVSVAYDKSIVKKGFSMYIRKPNVCAIPTIKIDIDSTSIQLTNYNEESAKKWQIEYGTIGMQHGEGTLLELDTSVAIVGNLKKYQTFDIYARTKCDDETYSPWVKQTIELDPYWTDVVKTRPSGYQEDEQGNIYISSAEGLAWLSILTNELHGQEIHRFEGKKVLLTSDIDLKGYRWYPIGRNIYLRTDYSYFCGTFDGQNHVVSNMYVRDDGSDLGLIGSLWKGSIKNVIIESGRVNSTCIPLVGDGEWGFSSSGIGGLVGHAIDCQEISNCHSAVNVGGNGGAGSLCGYVTNKYNDINKKTKVYNCSASGSVTGREACGGLIGHSYGFVDIRNCYTNGDVYIVPCDLSAMETGRGGLIGSLRYGVQLENCYSSGKVYTDAQYGERVGKVMGYIEKSYGHFLYGVDDACLGVGILGSHPWEEELTDTAQFHHEEMINPLLTKISIDGKEYDNLLEALNGWVSWQNDLSLKTWILDEESGYPVFDDYFVSSCANPSDLRISNATIVGDTIIQTKFEWTQIGEVDHWEVAYVPYMQDIDTGVVIQVFSNPCILKDIPVGIPLDFYVRAICDKNSKSNWSEPVTYIVDKLHWTEVVTSQPDGYLEDGDGNIYISSAEGLAWLASVANGLNGVPSRIPDYTKPKTKIHILADIDLSAYRWTAIGTWSSDFSEAIINGNNHIIKGLYCNELTRCQGLCGRAHTCDFVNLTLKDCCIRGREYVGIIAGDNIYGKVLNCQTVGTVFGIEYVGGIVGWQSGGEIKNSSHRGIVSVRHKIADPEKLTGHSIGGICGVNQGEVKNCFIATEVYGDFAGILTTSPNNVSNCYYMEYPTDLGIFSEIYGKEESYNISSFSGNGTTWILKTPPYVNGEFHTDLVTALNAWVDANNSEDTYHYWASDTANINEGFPVFVAQPISATEIDNAQVKVVPLTDNSVVLEWPAVEEAATYTIEIRQGEELVYLLVFDGDGQLVSSEYTAVPSREGRGRAPKRATQIANGWQYVVEGLEPNTEYTYTVVAKKSDDSVIYNETVSFDTKKKSNSFTITFVNWDGTVLQSSQVEETIMPEYIGVTPTRPDDEQYTYTFTGWTPEIVAVNGDATYTATYIAIPKSEGIDVLRWDSSNPKKIIHDGHLYILRGGKVYNIQGVRVE